MNSTADKTVAHKLPTTPGNGVEESQADGSDLLYYSDESVDATLQQLVDLLNIPSFASNRLRVKRVLGDRKMGHCFDFAPVELPIVERVQQECGPGAYEVWVYQDKELHKRLKLNVKEAASPVIGKKSHSMSAPVSARPAQSNAGVSGVIDDGLESELEYLRKENERLRNSGNTRSRGGRNHNNGNSTQSSSLLADLKGLADLGIISVGGSQKLEEAVSPFKQFREAMSFFTEINEQMGYRKPDGSQIEPSEDGDEGGGDINGQEFMGQVGQILGQSLQEARPMMEAFRTRSLTAHNESLMNHGYPPVGIRPEDMVMAPAQPGPTAQPGSDAGDEPKPAAKEADAPKRAARSPVNPENMTEKDFIKHQQMMFEGFLPALMARAQQDRDPEFWADYIFEEFDESFLKTFVLVPGALDQIAPYYPVVKSHRPWFDRCLKRIRDTIAECDQDDLNALNKSGKSTSKLEPIKKTTERNASGKSNMQQKADAPEKNITRHKGGDEEAGK